MAGHMTDDKGCNLVAKNCEPFGINWDHILDSNTDIQSNRDLDWPKNEIFRAGLEMVDSDWWTIPAETTYELVYVDWKWIDSL